jgi:hypothetical protein
MTPSDVVDVNRPMATGRLMPATLVQEKAGLLKGCAFIPENMMYSRAHVRLTALLSPHSGLLRF